MKTRPVMLILALLMLIPAVTAQETRITIETGDILDLIALEYDVSLNCLIEANEIERAWLIYAGDEIVIPDNCPVYDGGSSMPGRSAPVSSAGSGGGATAQEADSTPRTVPAPVCMGDPVRGRELDGNIYRVRNGDILDFIGCTFNVDTQCLAEVNGIDRPGEIFSGDELVIDESCGPWVDSTQPITTTSTTPADTADDTEAESADTNDTEETDESDESDEAAG